MKQQIKLIENEEKWEAFLKTQDPDIFVQSSKYGHFYKNLGEDFFLIGIEDRGKLVGGTLAVTVTARRGRFLYLPYGPTIDFSNEDLFKKFIKFLSNLAKESGADFIRVSPFLEDDSQYKKLFKNSGFRPAPMHILAENTWILELKDDEETLLKNMRQTTRNLIRRGEREGVEIKMSQSKSALNSLSKLLEETAKRHNFVAFPKKYIEAEFEAFKNSDEVQIFEAYFEGKLASSAIIFFYGDTAVYRHGASSSERIKCQPSYLLQWHAIKEAKKRGLKYYNFWGIAPNEAPKNHPFAGITTFKTGFGGYQKDLLHCQDLPISKKYWLNWTVETFRRVKRGF